MGDILFLGHRVPYPPDRGDKIRGFHILNYLSAREHVHVVAFADDARDMQREDAPTNVAGDRSIVWRSKSRLVSAVQALATRKPVSLTAFDDASLRAAVETVLSQHSIDTIYVFSSQMAQYLPAQPRQRVVMDFVDMDSAKFVSYAEQSRGVMRWLMQREARMLWRHERAVAGSVDASLFVSEAEAALFCECTGAERVHVVGNGIDTAFFDPATQFERIDAAGPLIVFTGQMDYRPNVEAVTWFADTILPNIRARHPHARFAIVGRAPTEAVCALTKQPGVIVTGEVADVRGWLCAASVVVAPLKLARGVQNKVLEAMAMARPVVASVAAAEGIDHDGTIRTGGTAEAFAEQVIAVLDDAAAAARMGREARVQMQRRYSWEARLAPLDAILGSSAEAPPRRSAA